MSSPQQQNPDNDICSTILTRYANSTAPQHRHLCATAAALRSILQAENLPLTPAAYFAAVITSIRDSPSEPLASLLAIVLPMLSETALSASKAGDSVGVVAGLIHRDGLSTGAVKSLVGSVGLLVGFMDLEEWGAVVEPVGILLGFSVDRRPKVRSCAQACLEKVFGRLKNSGSIGKGSKLVLSAYKKYIRAEFRNATENKELLETSDCSEAVQILSLLKVITPHLSKKVRVEILSDVYKLLGRDFSVLTRNVIGLLEVLVESTKAKDLVAESDNIVTSFCVCLSSGKNYPPDVVVSVLRLLSNLLNKLHDVEPAKCLQSLPVIFMSAKGWIFSNDEFPKEASEISKELIDRKFFFSTSCQLRSNVELRPETTAIESLCSVFQCMLDEIPPERVLTVISHLFLQLGDLSYVFMKDILLKLSYLAQKDNTQSCLPSRLQECIGSAVIAMGPEKVLMVIPVCLSEDKMACSNPWLIPILKKYVVGASLKFFLEHFVPLAKAIGSAYTAVKKEIMHNYAYELWDLLPAFCRYPTDTSETFESLARQLVVFLKEDPRLAEIIAASLQVLVNQNKNILEAVASQSADLPDRCPTHELQIDIQNSTQYSRKAVSKNIKALSSNSMDLIQSLADLFFVSSPEKRSYLKEAIGSLASLVKKEDLHRFYFSLLERFEQLYCLSAFDNLDGNTQKADKEDEQKEQIEEDNDNEKRNSLMELASSIVEAAAKDLVNIIFDIIKASFLAGDVGSKCIALSTLSQTLKVHSWFCSDRIDDLMNLLSTKSDLDLMVLENQLSCYHYILVHIIKTNDETLNTKAFWILNQMILTLKSKKESRKLAYDALLKVSGSLKDACSSDVQPDLEKLFVMVMGYLSSSSPHIISGAISALSLLIYSDAEFCLAVPNLIPAVLVLLQNKTSEVVKAALGFVKVLVSSLDSDDLTKLLPDVLKGVLPWSSVSKWHFRSKVGVIVEILIRKCGFDAIDAHVTRNYKDFVKSTAEGRRRKTSNADKSEALNSTHVDAKRSKKSFWGSESHKEKHSGVGRKGKETSRKPTKQKVTRSATAKFASHSTSNGHSSKDETLLNAKKRKRNAKDNRNSKVAKIKKSTD